MQNTIPCIRTWQESFLVRTSTLFKIIQVKTPRLSHVKHLQICIYKCSYLHMNKLFAWWFFLSQTAEWTFIKWDSTGKKKSHYKSSTQYSWVQTLSLSQSSDTLWNPSRSCSEPCPADSSPGRLVLPLLSLSLQVRWPLLEGGVVGGGEAEAAAAAALGTKIWLGLTVGEVGDEELIVGLVGRWMGGRLYRLRMPRLLKVFFWGCSPCCWLCRFCWTIVWTSSCKNKKKKDA